MRNGKGGEERRGEGEGQAMTRLAQKENRIGCNETVRERGGGFDDPRFSLAAWWW